MDGNRTILGGKNENAEQASRETTNNKARAVIEWFRSKHLYIIFLWPSQSTDLNENGHNFKCLDVHS